MMAQHLSEPPSVPNSGAWSQPQSPWPAPNPNFSSIVEEDVSFSMDLYRDQADHPLWRQFIQGMGSMESVPSPISEPVFQYSKENPNLINSMNSWSIDSPIRGLSCINELGFVGQNFCEGAWPSASCFSEPPIDFRDQKLGEEIFTSIQRSSSQSSVSGEAKKKRSEDNAESRPKKSKSEGSASSITKPQVPKVKLAERITALQQIVAPFGKTDTASVLLETINFISYLHEQVQLLSDPYMKSGFPKDHSSRGDPEGKEITEIGADLRSKGLCLVPISCTPPMYRENIVPDYWTPMYRGCLYR